MLSLSAMSFDEPYIGRIIPPEELDVRNPDHLWFLRSINLRVTTSDDGAIKLAPIIFEPKTPPLARPSEPTQPSADHAVGGELFPTAQSSTTSAIPYVKKRSAVSQSYKQHIFRNVLIEKGKWMVGSQCFFASIYTQHEHRSAPTRVSLAGTRYSTTLHRLLTGSPHPPPHFYRPAISSILYCFRLPGPCWSWLDCLLQARYCRARERRSFLGRGISRS